jgi:exopolyphosphatase / guanosine-5'-triphosphate,3'-diphosphate pyrophosphatase
VRSNLSEPEPRPAPHDAAVVDIGSNSIRLVLYRVEGRSIWPIYNEKVLAGLGRDLARTGKLSVEGVKAALPALRRFRAVLDSTQPGSIITVATAAVREAKDGPDFVKQVKKQAGFEVRVLSGEEEARYSALGVLAGIPGAEGVAGDLGGFSLELIRLQAGSLGKGITLPLGPFALRGPDGFDPESTAKEAGKRLVPAKGFGSDTFYAVGGAWRNLALIHMQMTGYPLKIVHEYQMSGEEAMRTARFIARQSKSSLERIQGLSKKRLDSIPYAAAVLCALVEKLQLKRIIICAWGVREGLLFDAMPVAVRRLDPMVEGFAALGGRFDQAETLGGALTDWIGPVMTALPPLFEQGRDDQLGAAACRLADFGSRFHPDHRAELVFHQVLRAPVAGIAHAERSFLAVAAYARHTASTDLPEPETLHQLLTPERLHRARALGAAIRLGCDISGRSPPLLAKSKIGLKDGALVLEAVKAGADLLLGEQTKRRAETLAGLLGRKLEIGTV